MVTSSCKEFKKQNKTPHEYTQQEITFNLWYRIIGFRLLYGIYVIQDKNRHSSVAQEQSSPPASPCSDSYLVTSDVLHTFSLTWPACFLEYFADRWHRPWRSRNCDEWAPPYCGPDLQDRESDGLWMCWIEAKSSGESTITITGHLSLRRTNPLNLCLQAWFETNHICARAIL